MLQYKRELGDRRLFKMSNALGLLWSATCSTHPALFQLWRTPWDEIKNSLKIGRNGEMISGRARKSARRRRGSEIRYCLNREECTRTISKAIKTVA